MAYASDTPNGRLCDAAKAGDIGGVRAALAEGADDLDLALIVAVRERQTQAAAYLLDAGANPGAWEERPLRLALKHGFKEKDLIRLLVERGANLSACGTGRLIYEAASYRELPIIRFVETYDDNMKEFAKEALAWAARRGDLDAIEFLVSLGVDPDSDDGRPLRAAAFNVRPEAVELLLKLGATYELGSDKQVEQCLRKLQRQRKAASSRAGWRRWLPAWKR